MLFLKCKIATATRYTVLVTIKGSVVDPHHVDAETYADPDSTYNPDADPDILASQKGSSP
jgi:hypothetical protein